MSILYEFNQWYCEEAAVAHLAERNAERDAYWKRVAYLRSLGRANPLSPDHGAYQRAVNRWFTVALLCIVAVAATVMGGWLFILKAFAVSSVVFIVTIAILWLATVVIPDTVEWLNGG